MNDHYSACLVIENGEILVRKNNMDLPTVKINEGETTEMAAIRAAKEAGIDAEIDRFFALEFFGKQVYTYLCRMKNKNNISDDYSWYKIDEIINKEPSDNISAIIDKIKVIL